MRIDLKIEYSDLLEFFVQGTVLIGSHCSEFVFKDRVSVLTAPLWGQMRRRILEDGKER